MAKGTPDPVTPSGVKNLLSKYNIQAKKSLGQNFLIDKNILDIIIEAADLAADDKVVEVGPGLGALSQRLLAEIPAGQLLAIEKDRKLYKLLGSELGGAENLTLVKADILEIELPTLLQENGYEDFNYKVVANLPYNITSPLLRLFLETEIKPEQMLIMVQKEVAERITADPGGKDYGVLSIAVQYYAAAEIVHIVPPAVFLPRPKVESALVSLDLTNPHPHRAENQSLFFQVVRAIFQQRRKTIRNSLSKAAWVDFDRDTVDQALAEVGIDSMKRGEKLSVQKIIELSNCLDKLI
ncbi:MAG: 16S rRNA (adenine(1518)-N(6)/adenine(1519)-N(6))-dimethyltransferase RsmA [Bacillota bacterium]